MRYPYCDIHIGDIPCKPLLPQEARSSQTLALLTVMLRVSCRFRCHPAVPLGVRREELLHDVRDDGEMPGLRREGCVTEPAVLRNRSRECLHDPVECFAAEGHTVRVAEEMQDVQLFPHNGQIGHSAMRERLVVRGDCAREVPGAQGEPPALLPEAVVLAVHCGKAVEGDGSV